MVQGINNEVEGVVGRLSEQVSHFEKKLQELGEVITAGKNSHVQKC